MTEDDAHRWVVEHFSAAAEAKLALLVALVGAEADRQNLIAASTVPSIWRRHVVDSAQLVALGRSEGLWLDIGTGGGFPGLVVALLRPAPIMLVEPRRLRGQFLERCVETLALTNVEVRIAKVEAITCQASTISARAVAAPEKLLRSAAHCATSDARWLLPRGQRADGNDLDRRWHGEFHVEHSVTDPVSGILVADRVRPR